MTESLHKIVSKYINHSDADDLCQDIAGWLMRNYDPRNNPLIDEICEDIWKSCRIADKALIRKQTDDYFKIVKND